MTTDMTSRERITRALKHEEADRVAIQDSPWATTVERWRREGLPEKTSPADFFGYEFERIGADLSLRFKGEVVEEEKKVII